VAEAKKAPYCTDTATPAALVVCDVPRTILQSLNVITSEVSLVEQLAPLSVLVSCVYLSSSPTSKTVSA